jgi:hypothetical protein
MADIWDKIDMGLPTIYVNFLRVRDEGADCVASSLLWLRVPTARFLLFRGA